MRKLMFLFSGILCMGFLSGMTPAAKHREVTITPERLRLIVNQKSDPYTIKVAYTLNIPADMIRSCACLLYQPYFIAPDHRYDLTPLVIRGKENLRQEKRLEALTGKQSEISGAMYLESNGDGMKIKLSQIVPFEVWMAQAKLRADVSLESCDRKKEVSVLTLADGVLWFPLGPGPALVKYVKEKITVEKEAEFSFLYSSGQYTFNPSYRSNDRSMKDMLEWISSSHRDSAIHFKKVVITGSCSPSGSMETNEWLAEKRATRMKQYLTSQVDIAPGLIEIKVISEDWEGFQLLGEKSDEIPDKKRISGILEKKITDSERELLLRELPEYDFIRNHLFPDLQKVTCRFYYGVDEEITKAEPL